MKKDYVKPSIEAAEIEAQSMMATSGNEVSISNETTDADASMAGERRGTWGSLWD